MKLLSFNYENGFNSIAGQSLLLFVEIQLSIFIAQLITGPISVLLGLNFDGETEEILVGAAAFILKIVLCFALFYRNKYNNKTLPFKHFFRVLLISLGLHFLLGLISRFAVIFSGTEIWKFSALWADKTVPAFQSSGEDKDIPLYIYLVLASVEIMSIIGAAALGFDLATKKLDKEHKELHKQ